MLILTAHPGVVFGELRYQRGVESLLPAGAPKD
jgi:hypothetical protein